MNNNISEVEEILNKKYGIRTREDSGEFRTFSEVYMDVYKKYLCSDTTEEEIKETGRLPSWKEQKE